ncbi:cobalamin-dependent protein [Candidatus Binatia bacterium]|nr:cobalamin-dependent protein [Candidatus Binatia bacterium]
MQRPVFLFSLDTEQFYGPPMTTGALKANFLARGRTAGETDVRLVHFKDRADVMHWLQNDWPNEIAPLTREALAAGIQPVFGLSCYTWNVAEFLTLARTVKRAVPGALVVAGGPHVQRAEDFLFEDGIDVVVLGEGETTFTELLDCADRSAWGDVDGLAFLTFDGTPHRTATRARAKELDVFPSALDVLELRGPDGEPLYEHVAYETSRGCPYKCSFCEWGTGAIGTKMFQFSLDRIRSDFDRLVAGGVHDIWLCDSNFGALKDDLEKARMIVDLRARTGLPQTFATSWSKNHNSRVREIVRLMHKNGLLPHYNFALQTLTPLALELSHRTNMRANDYEPVVKELAAEGVPICAELIWGLPGDTLREFETNLDHLLTIFPNVNIFGYTLLPGTEFYERRDEYKLETIPVAGYGKAKGEYVIGCHTFSRDEGAEGYFLITAYIMLARGQMMPITARFTAFAGGISTTGMLRFVLRSLLLELGSTAVVDGEVDQMIAYESRAEIYLALLSQRKRAYEIIRRATAAWFVEAGRSDLVPQAMKLLELDEALCPRVGPTRTIKRAFSYPAHLVAERLGGMDPVDEELLAREEPVELEIHHPARVGEVLQDPDGGLWMRGRIVSAQASGEVDEDAAEIGTSTDRLPI